jgi:mutator protein MutT
VTVRAGRVLVRRRAGDALLEGLFEFPGGKVEPGEEPADAARRELREEAGLDGGDLEPLVVHVFDYPDRKLRLHAFLVREPRTGELERAGGWTWVGIDELAALPMPAANRPIVQALRWRLTS